MIRHPRLGIIPLRPFKKQWEFIRLARRVRKVAGWDGPNRAGKSMAAAMLMVEAMLGIPIEQWPELPRDLRGVRLGPPVHVGCVTISREKSRDAQQKALADLLPRSLLRCKPWDPRTGFGSQSPKLVLRNGATCTFLSDEQSPQSFEAFAFTRAWIDEAVKPFVYSRLIARLIDVPEAKLLITAVAESAWIYRVLRMRVMQPDGLEPVGRELVDSICDSTMRDNELLDLAAIEDAITQWGGRDSREARMRVMGQYVHLEGVVMDRYDDVLHVCEAMAIPKHWTRYEWLDPGKRNPFAVLFVAIDPQGNRWWYDEIYERNRLPAEVAALILAKRRLHGYGEPHRCIVDPAANARRHWGLDIMSVRQQLAEAGVRTVAGRSGPGSIDAGNQRINQLFAHGRIKLFKHCVWARFELLNYKHGEPDPNTGEYLGDNERPVDAHNHLIAAARYGEHDSPQFVPPPPETPALGTPAHDLWRRRQEKRRRETAVFDD